MAVNAFEKICRQSQLLPGVAFAGGPELDCRGTSP
jgi:hypothetical protein